MNALHVKNSMSQTIELYLKDKASSIIMSRLLQIVNESMNDLQQIEEGLKRIRITVKLFVDEKLSEQVYTALRKNAGLS